MSFTYVSGWGGGREQRSRYVRTTQNQHSVQHRTTKLPGVHNLILQMKNLRPAMRRHWLEVTHYFEGYRVVLGCCQDSPVHLECHQAARFASHKRRLQYLQPRPPFQAPGAHIQLPPPCEQVNGSERCQQCRGRNSKNKPPCCSGQMIISSLLPPKKGVNVNFLPREGKDEPGSL